MPHGIKGAWLWPRRAPSLYWPMEIDMTLDVTADWDGEDWNFRGALIKKHWDMNSTCFSPMELGYSYSKAARLTPEQAIAALMGWLDETLQHPQGE